MSHGKQRKETNCLNCDVQVDGRYCKNCGQENIEPKQTFWGLITHFFNDVTHFDSKLWATLKPLVTKPGFLTEEYVKGRRVKYIDPVRMYLFISFAFFAMMFSLQSERKYISKETHPRRVFLIDSVRHSKLVKGTYGYTEVKINNADIGVMTLDSQYCFGKAYFDSVQRTLPDSLRSTGIRKYAEEKLVSIGTAYEKDPYNFFGNVKNHFKKSYSKIFFISLPFFSFFLYMLYIRRRKTYFYVSHAIFALHCYTVAFIVLACFQFFHNKFYSLNDELLGYAILAFIIGSFIYLYKAMHNFYKQGWFKTFIKFLLLLVSTLVLILLIAIILYLKSLVSLGVGY